MSRLRKRLRRRFARPIYATGASVAVSSAPPRVEVFIPSLGTRAATELTIRSLRAYDRSDYEIVVGDGGSTDGSVGMLTELADLGWLRLESRTDRWGHHDWIEHRVARSDAEYIVFCDSDMEFRRADSIRDLVATARRTGAVLVAAEFCASGSGTEPVSGSPIRMAERPSAWLFLVAPARVRELESSFAFVFTHNGTQIEGGLAYDTAAAWFAELRRRGLPWAVMPGSFTRRYRHHAGLTWRPLLGLEDDSRTARIRRHIDRRLVTLRARQRAS